MSHKPIDLPKLVEKIKEIIARPTPDFSDIKSIRRSDEGTEERIAYHEAGHSVAVAVLGLPLYRVQLIEFEENDIVYLSGETEPGPQNLSTLCTIEDLTAVLFSGLFSATKYSHREAAVGDLPSLFTKTTLHGAATDLAQYEIISANYNMEFFDGNVFSANLSEIIDGHWTAIKKVAQRLFDSRNVTGDEVKDIVLKGANAV
jgi:hypothetical protein